MRAKQECFTVRYHMGPIDSADKALKSVGFVDGLQTDWRHVVTWLGNGMYGQSGYSADTVDILDMLDAHLPTLDYETRRAISYSDDYRKDS